MIITKFFLREVKQNKSEIKTEGASYFAVSTSNFPFQTHNNTKEKRRKMTNF